jgi:hypothetical protein
MNDLVYVENIKSSAKYRGRLSAINRKKNKFCLTNLLILTKDYEYKAVSGTPEKRWFSFDSYRILEKTVV